MQDSQSEVDSQVIAQETPPNDVFTPPSIQSHDLLAGQSYAHYSPVPDVLSRDTTTECVLGVDEAGRGPVLGPMVYGVFYLPLPVHRSLLADKHHFDDSKVLTPQVRSRLMQHVCTPSTDLHETCGWATSVMSARDISAGMMKPAGSYNLNAQAMDTTVELIMGVLAKGVNVKEIYVDTIGPPHVYQTKLARIFPTIAITVAKKADSLYPCVSAASVCAKVTRDAALEACYHARAQQSSTAEAEGSVQEGWGSGYPSDARCSSWLKNNMDPVFGWGNECRFSWSTAKDLLEGRGGVKVDWPVEEDEDERRVTDFFPSTTGEVNPQTDELATWFGTPVTTDVF
ncbi:MAG: hypothetical protein M1825_001873 [Sarcosagium campestre]|nr:MAG: hypothetical protein M1825_001873 [Sarcosagium campestre]